MLSFLNGVGQSRQNSGAISSSAPPTSPYISTTNLLSALGIVRLIDGYNGPAIRVRRESDDAETDINFAASSDLLNTAALDTFRSGSYLWVTTIYDQSGNGWHATQTIQNDQPQIYAENIDGDGLNPIIFTGDSFGASGNHMEHPAGFSANAQAVTDYLIMNPQVSVNDANSAAAMASMGLSWNASGAAAIWSQRPGSRSLTKNRVFENIGNLIPLSQKQVVVNRGNATDRKVFYNDQSQTLLAPPNEVFAGGRINYTGGSTSWKGHHYFWGRATYSVAHDDATVAATQSTLYGAYSINRTATKRLIVSGNSIAQGAGDTYLRGYMQRALPLLNEHIELSNNSIFGRTLVDEHADISIFENYYDSAIATNIIQCPEPTNDINANGSADTAYGNTLWTSYGLPFIQAMKTAGYEEILVPTIIDRTGFSSGQEDARNQYNANVRNNAATEGYTVVDYDSLTLTYSDNTHPDGAGHQTMANYLAGILNSIA